MKVTPFLVAMVSITLIIPSCVAFAGLFQLADQRYKQEFCRSVDGDTINCGGEVIRLNGIDAPEKHGCPAYRNCAPGDPYLSEASLQVGLDQGDVVITRLGTDRYGRTIAMVRAGMTDLSCWQLDLGAAEYVARWDIDHAARDLCMLDGKSDGNSLE